MIEKDVRDGILVRHTVDGYQGCVEGTTRIKELFTDRGQPLNDARSKQTFQYRVVVEGESVRRVVPAEDIEIVEEIVGVARAKRSLKGASARKGQKPKGTNVVSERTEP